MCSYSFLLGKPSLACLPRIKLKSLSRLCSDHVPEGLGKKPYKVLRCSRESSSKNVPGKFGKNPRKVSEIPGKFRKLWASSGRRFGNRFGFEILATQSSGNSRGVPEIPGTSRKFRGSSREIPGKFPEKSGNLLKQVVIITLCMLG